MSRVEHIGSATLYLGDCREILPTLARPDAIVTDPPYGLGDKWQGGKREWGLPAQDGMGWDADVVPYVSSLPSLADALIIWGGNYYPLPPVRGWLFWNKGQDGFSSGDGELAWTTLDMPIRQHRISRNVFTPVHASPEVKYHPTQKPIGLMKWSHSFLPDAKVIADPFMGSGSTGVAAVQMEKAFVGIECDQKYFDIACRRLDEAQRQFTLAV